MLDRLKALMLLEECTGVHIWSPETCQVKGVPQAWIDELVDGFESGFQTDRQTIYVGDAQGNESATNQFEGVHDRDLAKKLGEFLGIDVQAAASRAFSPEAEVMAIKEAVEDG